MGYPIGSGPTSRCPWRNSGSISTFFEARLCSAGGLRPPASGEKALFQAPSGHLWMVYAALPVPQCLELGSSLFYGRFLNTSPLFGKKTDRSKAVKTYEKSVRRCGRFLLCIAYSTREGALYTRAASSLFSMYRLLGSEPNSSILEIRSLALVSSSPCSLTNQSRNCMVRKSFTS